MELPAISGASKGNTVSGSAASLVKESRDNVRDHGP